MYDISKKECLIIGAKSHLTMVEISVKINNQIKTVMRGTIMIRVFNTLIFLLFIPFLLIDMVIASVLLSAGMMMLPPVMISLPFKLMLFILVDGWGLLAKSLSLSFS